jgi:hypothetical protein
VATIRRWRITFVTALVTAAVLVTAGVLIAGGGSGDTDTPATPGTDTTPTGVPAPRDPRSAQDGSADLGPEGVPLLGGAALGPARAPAAGASSGGIPCGSSEQLDHHVHARLSIFIAGKSRSIPLGVGIGPPLRITKTSRGGFVSGGRCYSFLHTHSADGVIHIEAPRHIVFTLGEFFDVWRQRLDSRHVGRHRGHVVAYVNGRRYRGDPRAIPLKRHAQIQLEVGQPLVAPTRITFPPGL